MGQACHLGGGTVTATDISSRWLVPTIVPSLLGLVAHTKRILAVAETMTQVSPFFCTHTLSPLQPGGVSTDGDQPILPPCHTDEMIT